MKLFTTLKLLMLLSIISLKSYAQASDPYIETDGIIVIECESIDMLGNWYVRNLYPDYTGTGYISFEGAANGDANNAAQTLEYKIQITNPGTYTIKMRSFNDAENETEHNDIFFGVDASQRVKTTSHLNHMWNWDFRYENGGVHHEHVYDLTAGEHTLYVVGRSTLFGLDRIHIYRSDVVDPLNAMRPESPQSFASPAIAISNSSIILEMDEGILASITDNDIQININNAGIGTLEGVVANDDNLDWLDLNFTDNVGNEQVLIASVNANAELLAVGEHSGTITINATGAEPVTIPIVLNIDNSAAILLDIISATASYVEGANPASNAIDDDMGTRWASNGDPNGANGWIYFDLGGQSDITKIVINWEDAFASNYIVQISDDHENWTDVKEIINSDGGIDEVYINSNARYVRILGQALATLYGLSIYEVDLYGTEAIITDNLSVEDNNRYLFPNPTNKEFSVYMEEEATLNIYNLDGKHIYQSVLNPGQNVVSESIPNGIYIVKINTISGKLLSNKLIKF